MKFAMSYSFGKDSALAVNKMIEAGNEPVCLITAFNKNSGKSWSHGVSPELMGCMSDAIGLPVITADSSSATDYADAFAKALEEAKKLGAEAAVFGDIDIDEHLNWDREVCKTAGLQCVTPLFGMERGKAVKEALGCGIAAVIKVVSHSALGDEFLGKTLTSELVEKIAARGADICGENGEYHTIVIDAPFFKHPANVVFGEITGLANGAYSAIEIKKL